MLQLNRVSASHSVNSFSTVGNIATLSSNHHAATDIYPELAELSHQKQWILYTGNCPRPVSSELMQHRINTQNIIHMKPSNQFSEEEIVIKALEAGTAIAIVASADLSFHARARINVIANLKKCAVFFLNEQAIPSRLCH